MVFSSLPFLFVFLPAVLAVYYILPKKCRNFWLFAASLVFYGYGEPVFILLMLFSVTLNFCFGIIIGKMKAGKMRKTAFIICIVINLSLLGYFKYTSLFLSTLRTLPVFSFISIPEIALPIGISFYTFQTMSYIIDIYRGNCAYQKNYISFGAYVALFPQLIAGPIVRYVDVEEQLSSRKESIEKFSKGIRLFTLGLAKKVLLANEAGALWSAIKAAPDSYGTLASWLGIIAFTFQIYFDFSGYSDMARGLGNMFGFEFGKNFDYPYISKSITEFWRRWHISLSTWFREYVYIPLGGNRRSPARRTFNIFAVWALTGLWHGASWNFLIWGIYFAVLLTLEKNFLLDLLSKLPSFVSHIYTMFFVVFGWLIFDFTDIKLFGAYLSEMFTFSHGFLPDGALETVIGALPLLAVSVFASLPVIRKAYFKLKGKRFTSFIEAAAIAATLVLCTASLVNTTYNPFLYFRF